MIRFTRINIKKMKTKLLIIAAFWSFNVAFSQKVEKKIPEIKLSTNSRQIDVKPAINKNIPLDPKKIHTEVDQLAEFPGGIKAFRQKITDAFDRSKITESGILKTQITFVVEISGKITDVKAIGMSNDFNEETLRAVKSILNLWSPAKIDNKSVRYLYRLPVKMEF